MPNKKKPNKKKPSFSLVEDNKDTLKNKFSVVGIGASAGGLEALEQFFSHVPTKSPFAFVVILHLSPDYKSLMAQLLSKNTSMQVNSVENNTLIRPNSVYIIPPKKTMTIFNNTLYLHDRQKTKMPTFPIDIFLQSLVVEKKEDAIGIILSGTGSDGTRGIRAIKESGGMVMVQDPASAKFDGMPNNAISTGLVDYVLRPNDMPNELVNYIEHPQYIDKTSKPSIFDDAFLRILQIIKQVTNLDFSAYKKETILRRIKRKMTVTKITSLEEFADYLEVNIKEVTALQKDLLIGVTKFFRDQQAFEYLGERVIPEIVQEARNSIKVWIAGCSTGEEAYSVAILFYEQIRQANRPINLKIFATDIDKDAIAKASLGTFSESTAADVPKDYLSKYFVKEGEDYKISKVIRELIIFTAHDISKDPPFHKLDLVVCRNMLIYFQPKLQKRVFATFNFALKQNAFLFLGSSESAETIENFFVGVHAKFKVYRSLFKTRSINLSNYDYPDIDRYKKSLDVPLEIKDKFPLKTQDNKELNIINELIINEFATACFLVTEKFDFIRYFGDGQKFLSVPKKLNDLSILNMVGNKLSTALGTALRKVVTKRKTIKYNEVVIQNGDNVNAVNIIIKPYNFPSSNQIWFLIILKETHNSNELVSEDSKFLEYNVGKNASQRIDDLEQELNQKKESLQATIEELQTSNEELIASNEELQSTNEELQSVNEELHTINSEHQANIMELTELNDDINNLLQSTQIGTLFLDNDLKIRKFNRSITTEFRITENDLGRPINHFSSDLKNDGFISDIQNVIESLQPLQKEIANTKGDWYLMKIVPYRTSENHIRGVVITLVDINKLKEAEELKNITEQLKHEVAERTRTQKLLQKQNEDMNLIFEAVADKYFRLDRNLIFLDVRIGRTKHVYTNPKELIGTSFNDIFPIKIFKTFKTYIDEAIATKKEQKFEITLPFKGGKRRQSCRVFNASDGQIILVITDIEERKITEKTITETNQKLTKEINKVLNTQNALERKTRQLETSNQALEQFAYSTSHDLKEPLRSIGNFAQIIEKQFSEILPEEGLQYLSIIQNNANRMYGMIDKILSYSMVGQKKPEFSTINTKDTVEKALLSLNDIIKSSEVKIVLRKLPVIESNDTLLVQIFQNLIGNSIKYRDINKPLVIEVGARKLKDNYSFYVKDNGIGFEQKYYDHIFVMFKQLKSDNASEGSGIGLALCKRFVEMLGGEIKAESEKGEGSIFTFTHPIKKKNLS